MDKTIVLIFVGSRSGSAVRVQEVLTKMGCFIKVRLGVHDGTLGECSNVGLIFLDVTGSEEDKSKLVEDLEIIPNVQVKRVDMHVNC